MELSLITEVQEHIGHDWFTPCHTITNHPANSVIALTCAPHSNHLNLINHSIYITALPTSPLFASVITTLPPNPKFYPLRAARVELHDLPVPAWVFSGHSGFLPL